MHTSFHIILLSVCLTALLAVLHHIEAGVGSRFDRQKVRQKVIHGALCISIVVWRHFNATGGRYSLSSRMKRRDWMEQTASFGYWLRRRRKALDLTQEALAQQAGCAVATIRKIEADERRPSRDLAEHLACRLEIPPEERAAFLKAARAELATDRFAIATQPIEPPAAWQRPTTNLPAPTSVFIGREREVASVSELLRRDGVRLVTLTGAGGSGKTRLALRVAAELLALTPVANAPPLHPTPSESESSATDSSKGLFPNGVWFINLAPISDPALTASTIAQALDIRQTNGQPIRDRLKDYLCEKRALLLLDNFEQIVESAPLVSELLAAAPGLKVLVTSRRPLHLSGEHEFAVPPLELPPQTAGGAVRGSRLQRSVAELTQYDAVRLFIERAQAVKADFTVTDENAPSIAEVCCLLDGVPLAIELAAARVRLFPPQALLAHLDKRLTFLTGGPHDLPARQQTLRNTLDWSYDLLDAGEKMLFARLSVFVGGCTLEAVQTVCNADDELPFDVADGVAALLEKSLLQQEQGVSCEPRFRMLETTREFALERLEASGEAEALRRRHAEYFLMLAETAEPELCRAEQLTWLQRLEQEHHNFRSALAWSQTSAAGVEIGLRLAGALGRFWQMRNHQSEGYAWLASILARPMAEPSVERAKALNAAGFLVVSLAQAKMLFEEALAIGRALGNTICIADALRGLETTIPLTDAALRQALLEESLALCQALGDTWRSAMALDRLGFLARSQGDFGRAIERCEQSLTLFRQLGDRWGSVSSSYILIAARAGITHNYDELRPQINAIITQWRELGDKQSCAGALNDLGEHARFLGDYASAARYYAEGLALFQELGNRPFIALVLCNQGYLAHNQGDDARAAAFMAESLALVRETTWQEFIAYCLAGSGWVAMGQGWAERAARLLGAAKTPFDAAGDLLAPIDRAEFDRNVAAARAQLGDEAFAAAWQAGQAMTLEQAVAYALADDIARPGERALAVT
jgi:predicted ATPase/DNA-binding XRE family transcriptional regulator